MLVKPLIFLAECVALTLLPEAGAVRLLVVTGGHDYPTSFYSLFEQEELSWDHAVSAEEAYRRDLRPAYDVLVLYDMPKTVSAEARANLRAFAEAGKGIVVIHHAIVSHGDWDWYRDLVGGRYFEQPGEGHEASTYLHDVDMKIEEASPHAITDGLTPFTIHDETYKGMWMAPDNTVLLTTSHETSDGPVAWISSYRPSRVVYVQLGHGPEAHRNPTYRALIRRAILWTADRATD
jgi:type 1 glutamine amidotransferase